jgi:hypothetical protein
LKQKTGNRHACVVRVSKMKVAIGYVRSLSYP